MTTIKLSIISFSLILLTGFRYTEFDFARTLRQDRLILKDGRFIGDTSRLKLFDKFARQDISKFQYSFKDNGNHHIETWTYNSSETSKIIKITSKIPVDTIIHKTNVNSQKTIPKNIKVTFEFVTYEFTQRQKPSKLIYLSIRHEGLSEYYIDNKEFQISYVDAFVGMDLVYDKTRKEIMTILTEN